MYSVDCMLILESLPMRDAREEWSIFSMTSRISLFWNEEEVPNSIKTKYITISSKRIIYFLKVLWIQCDFSVKRVDLVSDIVTSWYLSVLSMIFLNTAGQYLRDCNFWCTNSVDRLATHPISLLWKVFKTYSGPANEKSEVEIWTTEGGELSCWFD